MTRLIHLTDLHFGLHRSELVDQLHYAVQANRPDLVIVSGDLTQRALRSQFNQAMAFIRSLDLPFLVIPGNHDVSAYNPVARILTPFRPYRTSVSQDLLPSAQVDRLRLFSTNTVNAFRWRAGKTRRAEIDRICAAMREGPSDVTNILVAHHPFEEPQGFNRGETRGAGKAMTKLADAGLHVLLTGHLHHWDLGLGISRRSPRAILQVQTGTALCSRPQENRHGFAVLDFDADWLSITPWVVNEVAQRFEPHPRPAFAQRDGLWHAVSSAR